MDPLHIDPVDIFRTHLKENIRPDGRSILEMRPLTVSVGSITTANGSSLVKLGDTTVICGVKGELTVPTAKEPSKGIIVPNLELSPLCSSKFKQGPPCEQAQVVTKLLDNILRSSHMIDLEDLCIQHDQLVWVLYCDLVCLNYDGNIIDASVVALTAALRNVQLPGVTVTPETGSPEVDRNSKRLLSVKCLPVATTFTMFDGTVTIADPTTAEEDVTSGELTVVTDQDQNLIYMERPGGVVLSESEIKSCIKRAMVRGSEVQSLYKAVET